MKAPYVESVNVGMGGKGAGLASTVGPAIICSKHQSFGTSLKERGLANVLKVVLSKFWRALVLGALCEWAADGGVREGQADGVRRPPQLCHQLALRQPGPKW